jgi:hypothetical protein
MARYVVPGRVYVIAVLNSVPTVGFEGAAVHDDPVFA